MDENHPHIISLLLETYVQLALLVNSINEEQKAKVKELGEDYDHHDR